MKLTKKRKSIFVALLLIVLIFFLIPIPSPLFQDSYSSILEAKNGELLSAKIAPDGQWRFPEGKEVPEKFATCIRLFEDEYFYQHPGVNPVSLFRAAKQNWQAGKIVSGGSTLSMQVVRLARKGKERNVWQKLIETFWTFRIELRYSKKEILALYAAHAPFGGNVVGLEAASWRYYKRAPENLSWAESAALAVLPNAPALIFPGRNQDALLAKRNRLLHKLKNNGFIDETTMELAMSEDLPGSPNRLPQKATHLLNRSMQAGYKGQRLKTSIHIGLQNRINELVQQHYLQWKQNEVHNLAVLVIDNKANEVMAYIGNSKGASNKHGQRVDIITSQRSTGSLLKPFLYGLAWQDGMILPQTLLADIPTQYGGYAPKNFNKKYEGAVPASEALTRSLNVPAVRLLKEYGLDRFYDEFQKFPIPSINRGANHYGLSIMLGGAEASLWEMCTAYKGMSESLRLIHEREYEYDASDYTEPNWILEKETRTQKNQKTPKLKAGAIWQLVESLKDLNRPGQEEGWESYAGRKKIAWKTGTSFGLRDAWAIGVCPEYTIGVWVGNADGEGRPGLTGISAAAPILFETLELLPKSTWYETPHDELISMEICSESGYLKGMHCPEADTVLSFENASRVPSCPFHQSIQLNKTKTKRVNSSCYAVAEMQTQSYLVLPPLMEWYYKKREPNYKPLPNWEIGCLVEASNPMEFISPESADHILIPIGLDGEQGRLVVKIAHRNPNARIYWHIDDEFLGESKSVHSMELNPNIGKHTLTLVDNLGNSLSKTFEVVD